MPSFLSSAIRFPRVALRHGDLLSAFVRRDLASRYEGSILGKLWPLLQPALMLTVYGLVFSLMLRVNLRTSAAPAMVADAWITVFYMGSGILCWICVVDAINRCTMVVVENNNLIKKVAFPSELLPTYSAMVSFVHMLIGLAIFAALYAFVILALADGPIGDNARELVHLAWLPLPIALQFVFVTGLGMLFAAVNVYFRDLSQILQVATTVWMFFSPVWYRIESLATTKDIPAWILEVIRWNPLYHLLALYRACFPYERGTTFPVESAWIFGAIAAVVFVLGHGLFQSWKGRFADEV